jgi:GH25 family lysozyme M1 (1,4-beta-N-acetylmuramidase)
MRTLPLLVLVFAACHKDDPGIGVASQALPMMCPTQTVEGIDVYDGTGTVDWTAVKGAGRAFAFIKATQGDYNTQSRFAANWKGARDAGLLRSPYHFFDPTIDGIIQAQHFLDALDAGGGLQIGDLPPMLDIECPTSSDATMAAPNCEHAGDSGWAPTDTITQRVFDWLDAVEASTGQKAIVYSYSYWFGGTQVTDARLAGYPLFVATIASCALVPAPWSAATFWQYSATAKVAGVAGNCDVDRYFGTEDQLKAMTVPPPTPDLGGDSAAASDLATASSDARGCGCDLTSRAPMPRALWLLALLVWLCRRRASVRSARPTAR